MTNERLAKLDALGNGITHEAASARVFASRERARRNAAAIVAAKVRNAYATTKSTVSVGFNTYA